MYRLLIDGVVYADSRSNDMRVVNPVVNLEVNAAGTMTFTIPKTHPYIDDLEVRNQLVEVYMDDEEEPVFEGVIVTMNEEFYGNVACSCEGSLTFLNDSIQRPALYQGKTATQLVTAYITAHNNSVSGSAVDKSFAVGTVAVNGGNNMLRYTNWNSTLKELQEDIISDLGGYFRVRHTNGQRVLDVLAESPNTSSQIVRLGENLLDYKSNLDSKEICTVLIPLGAKKDTSSIEGLDEYLTISSVNGGKDYLTSTTGVATYGKVEQVQKWDDVTTASALKTKGQAYLNSEQYSDIYIEANVIDLHYADANVERLKLMDMVRVVSPAHNLDREFMLTKMTINLDSPESNSFTLGKDVGPTISTKG